MNKSYWWQASFIVIGVLLGAGVIILVTRPPRGKPIELLPAPTASPIVVYVSGSVQRPGLYSLPIGSRVNDAIQLAGGYSEQANVAAINLAEVLIDGEQINVPGIQPTSPPGNVKAPDISSNLLININTATLDELDRLPEIGPVTAQRIIDYRMVNGPFKAIEDLLNVEKIGQVTFDKIKDLVTVGTSP